MERDAPYLDVNKHNEGHPYYNVPPEASADQVERASPIIGQFKAERVYTVKCVVIDLETKLRKYSERIKTNIKRALSIKKKMCNDKALQI